MRVDAEWMRHGCGMDGAAAMIRGSAAAMIRDVVQTQCIASTRTQCIAALNRRNALRLYTHAMHRGSEQTRCIASLHGRNALRLCTDAMHCVSTPAQKIFGYSLRSPYNTPTRLQLFLPTHMNHRTTQCAWLLLFHLKQFSV